MIFVDFLAGILLFVFVVWTLFGCLRDRTVDWTGSPRY
jgi:hypothetical protein